MQSFPHINNIQPSVDSQIITHFRCTHHILHSKVFCSFVPLVSLPELLFVNAHFVSY